MMIANMKYIRHLDIREDTITRNKSSIPTLVVHVNNHFRLRVFLQNKRQPDNSLQGGWDWKIYDQRKQFPEQILEMETSIPVGTQGTGFIMSSAFEAYDFALRSLNKYIEKTGESLQEVKWMRQLVAIDCLHEEDRLIRLYAKDELMKELRIMRDDFGIVESTSADSKFTYQLSHSGWLLAHEFDIWKKGVERCGTE